jgi:hypothetical protein
MKSVDRSNRRDAVYSGRRSCENRKTRLRRIPQQVLMIRHLAWLTLNILQVGSFAVMAFGYGHLFGADAVQVRRIPASKRIPLSECRIFRGEIFPGTGWRVFQDMAL